MFDCTLRRVAWRVLLWVPLWALVLAGCSSGPDPFAKHRRNMRVPAPEKQTLDGLPLLRLQTDRGINLDEYTPSEISFVGRRYTATEAKYRGATSSTYPKKSFTLKFAKKDPLDDEGTGFTNVRKVVLVSSFDDNSYLRQALALQLWNRMDPEHLQVRTAFVSVLLNEEYEGIYLMTDHVDEHFVEHLGMWEDGNLYQARARSATFTIGKDRSPHAGFSREGNDQDENDQDENDQDENDEGAFADLDAFVEWLAQADDTELKDNLGAYIDVRDYMDWWILATLIDASDSVNKNSFHYHDPRPADPPNVFRCLPWDYNASFGQDWRSRRRTPTIATESYNASNRVFARLTGSEHFASELRARYSALSREALSVGWVQSWLADTRAYIERGGLQDEACWSDAQRAFFGPYRHDFNDYATENAYVDEWVVDRWTFVTEQLAAP